MEHEERTIAEVLGDNGYRCGYIGKWHLGDDAWYPERQGDWKLIKFWEGPRELYNLKNDLAEETDLSETMPDKVAALEALLDQRLKSQEASLPRPNPDYTGN